MTFSLLIGCEQGMSQNTGENMAKMISSLGFENVRLTWSGNTLMAAYENNRYRWNVRGLAVMLDTIANHVDSSTQIRLVTLSREIPVFETQVRAGDWNAYRNGAMKREDFDKKITFTNRTNETWDEVKKEKRSNSSRYKFDFIIYPQIYIQNNYFDYIYEIQFNIAPAVEFSLWRGNRFVGQVIFPVYNNPHLDKQGNYIRPGYITIAQDFRLPGAIFGAVTLGKFNADRYGVDLSVAHPFKNAHWQLSGSVGVTGWTYFENGTLYLGRELKPTWNVTGSYYYSRFDLQMDLRVGRYIYGDYGARVDVTRNFGETSVGVYAMYSGGEPNGGFHFAIPFPPGNRGKTRHIRVLPPRYFDFEYRGANLIVQGRYYKASPDLNRSGENFNLIYIQNSLH